MLLTLLTAISSGTLLVGAVTGAKYEHVGVGGYAVSVAIGLLLAAGNYWMVLQLAGRIAARVERHSQALYLWYLRALYVIAALWIPFGTLIGQKVTIGLLRLIV
jgi:hypothetical protein